VLDPRIVIVDIDAKSLNEVGRFPWSRNVMAKLVDQLVGHYHAAAVGFDVSFPEPDTSSGYAVLERLAQRELKDVPGCRANSARSSRRSTTTACSPRRCRDAGGAGL
jgi:adenylate cyclase